MTYVNRCGKGKKIRNTCKIGEETNSILQQMMKGKNIRNMCKIGEKTVYCNR